MININHAVQPNKVEPFLQKIAKKGACLFMLASLMLGLSVEQAKALTIFSASGISAKGVKVAFEAQFSIAEDVFVLSLLNTSPQNSLNPDDTLGSFYFDIVDKKGVRPDLVLQSAVGNVYTGVKSGPDTLTAALASLVASDQKRGPWQFADMNPKLTPSFGFGLGTVGNSALANNFDGKITGNLDYVIYTGEVTTQNLSGKLLVKDQATFTFSGVYGFSEKDIANSTVFGLGTAPDSLLTGRPQSPPPAVPEPSTWVLLAAGFAGMIVLNRKKNK